jgi:hypothetical protein
MKSVTAILLLTAMARLSVAQSPPTAGADQQIDRHKLVQLAGIEVTGTRFPTNSIIRLSGLKIGQMVNYDVLSEACNRITSTGLVSTIDYAYKVEPGKPGVVVSFKLWDELPLLPASVYPHENEDRLWACLQSADPIFTRELPNTKAALHFYTTNIEQCLANDAQHNLYPSASVVCDAKGKAATIVFIIRDKQ